MRFSKHIAVIFSLVLLLLQLSSVVASLNTNTPSNNFLPNFTTPLQQNAGLKILGPNGDTVPVVNEKNQIMVNVMDSNGTPITSGLTFETDSPDILSITNNGMITGNQQGFATITAKMGSISASAFVAVSKVTKGKGKKVPGDTKVDSSGAIYISDPTNHIIFKKSNGLADANLFAGRSGIQGRIDAEALNSTFAGPIGIAVDNRPKGGIFIADVLNNSVRKINFDNTVITILGNGSQGTMGDVTPFAQAMFKNPQGIAIDSGGSLFIADTGNNAIYLADFARQEVRLLAGNPGMAGKADGQGRAALFNRPVSLSVKAGATSFFATATQEVVLVADTGNGKIRSISRDGTVKTLGPIANTTSSTTNIFPLADSEFTFTEPSAIDVDDVGNIYVVEKSGVRIISQNVNGSRQVMSLAQPTSFGQVSSVALQGTQAIVLDKNSTSDNDAVSTVTVGAPTILSMSRNVERLEGGNTEVVITGKNFAPESLVVLGDTVIKNAIIESATRIRIPNVPPQNAPGDRTLSVRTRGGVAQTKFSIFSKPFSELNNGEITTIAGGVPFLGDSGLATNASFNSPQDVLVDGNGNIIIADSGSARVRRIDSSGIITTIAGNGAFNSKGDNGLAISAGINLPAGVAIDSAGNTIISDSRGDRIRKVDAKTGIITTIAGTGEPGFSGDGGLATQAKLSFPIGIAIDSSDNLYIVDSGNNRIRKLDLKSGIITTVAGNGLIAFSGDGGLATDAAFNFPTQVNVDSAGNLYILDNNLDFSANGRIRRVDIKSGIVNTVAGNGTFRFNGDNISALSAGIDPFDVEIDRAGNIFFADLSNNRVRRVDAKTGIITTIAGNGKTGFSGDGGLATNATLSGPDGIALDGLNNVIIADQLNNRIRKVDANTNIITTVAGIDIPTGDGGLAVKANLGDPFSIVVDPTGNLLIVDRGNIRIRQIDINSGIISTYAGNGILDSTGDGGPATQASFAPVSIALDNFGNLFIADELFNVIRRVDRSGNITTIAGINNKSGFSGDNGLATNAMLNAPSSVAVDSNGNLFIADTNNSRVRRVDAKTGIITTVAGNGNFGFSGDGGAATQATLFLPFAVATDKNGNFFIVDAANFRIRRVDAKTGVITTVAGNGLQGFGGDGGQAIRASFEIAFGLTVDNSGNIFLADTANHRIRRIDTNGIMTTVAGTGDSDYTGDGTAATTASLNRPKGVAIDSSGNLYVAGGFNNAIRIVKGMGSGGPRGDFTLAANPTSQNITAGQSANFDIRVQGLNGFAQAVNLSTAVSPFSNGVTANFSTNPVNPGNNITLTVSVAANVPTTSFIINVIGSSGQFIRSIPINLNVTANAQPDFSISVNPSSQNVTSGTSTSFTVGIQPINNFSQPVNLTATVNPANGNFTSSFSQSTITPGNSSTLTINVAANTPSSSATITVTGTVGQLVRTQTAVINIISTAGAPTIAKINDQTLAPGQMLVVPISATDPNTTSELKFSLTTAPSYVSLTDDGNGKGRLTISPSATETQGGRVTVRATNTNGLFGETSFNVTLSRLSITSVVFAKPKLTITGLGFGQSGATVLVNNQSVSSFISSQSDTIIVLKGNKKKLNIKKGANTVAVMVNGVTSNTVIFNF